jgi:hypothetical protein
MTNHPRVVHSEDYRPLIGAEAVERSLKKAKPLQDLHVVNVNSTYYGDGVAELLGVNDHSDERPRYQNRLTGDYLRNTTLSGNRR